MLACILRVPGHAVIEETPVPKIGPGEVLVKMRAAGICGTDVEKLEGGLGPGGILGHEVSGTIEKTNGKLDGLSVGDRVVAHHHVSCGKCHYCGRGDNTMCSLFKETNLDPCGLAEYFRVPRANVERGAIIPIPEDLSFEEAALAEPSACCLRALRTVGVDKGDTALVVGLGPTGLTHIQLLRNLGAAKIIGMDVSQKRLNLAEKLGASTVLNPNQESSEQLRQEVGIGVDLAIVAVGNESAFGQALGLVRKGGRICLFGAPKLGSTHPLDLNDLFTRQLSIIPSYSCVEEEIREILDMTWKRKLDLKTLISHRYELKDSKRALENARSPGLGVKTIIVCGA